MLFETTKQQIKLCNCNIINNVLVFLLLLFFYFIPSHFIPAIFIIFSSSLSHISHIFYVTGMAEIASVKNNCFYDLLYIYCCFIILLLNFFNNLKILNYNNKFLLVSYFHFFPSSSFRHQILFLFLFFASVTAYYLFVTRFQIP